MEILLEPFLVITGDEAPTGVRVTLVLNTGGWFRDVAGGWLDPRNPANRSAIEANIQASFEAFEGTWMERPGRSRGDASAALRDVLRGGVPDDVRADAQIVVGWQRLGGFADRDEPGRLRSSRGFSC